MLLSLVSVLHLSVPPMETASSLVGNVVSAEGFSNDGRMFRYILLQSMWHFGVILVNSLGCVTEEYLPGSKFILGLAKNSNVV